MRQSQQICRVTRKTLPINIQRALSANRSVVVTGRSRMNERDIPIGKTTAVINGFVPIAERDNLTVEYFSLAMGLCFAQQGQTFPILAANMQEAVRVLQKDADIFVLNHAFHLFGPPQSKIYQTEMRPYIQQAWKAIGAEAEQGKQFVFISALHPAA